MGTAQEMIKCFEEQIILPFRSTHFIISDNSTCFTATTLENSLDKNGIKLGTCLAYASISNRRSERSFGTIKRAIGKLFFENPMNWDQSVPEVLYCYCRLLLAYGFSAHELIYGVVPRMSLEYNSI